MNTLTQQIIEIGGAATALASIFLVVRVVYRRVMAPIRKLHYFLDDWFGTPARPGVDSRPGVMARLDAIEHELHPNSSLSMRDAVDRIERAIHEGNLLAAAASAPPVTVHVAPAATPSLTVVHGGDEHEEGDAQGDA